LTGSPEHGVVDDAPVDALGKPSHSWRASSAPAVICWPPASSWPAGGDTDECILAATID